MLLINANRNEILTCMQPGGVAGEIGVAEAYYSGYILQNLKPRKLHLIDPWRFQDISNYLSDANNTTDKEGDRRYKSVQKKFSASVDAGVVVLHRALSSEIVDSFPDEYFDFLHIDAMHTYAGCLADLRMFDRKVKRTGFITGHDYQTIPIARDNQNEVIRAVYDFVKETKYTFLALTFEEAPTYVLAKEPDSTAVLNFMATLISKYMIMAQIANAENKSFEQIAVPFSPQRYIFSFD